MPRKRLRADRQRRSALGGGERRGDRGAGGGNQLGVVGEIARRERRVDRHLDRYQRGVQSARIDFTETADKFQKSEAVQRMKAHVGSMSAKQQSRYQALSDRFEIVFTRAQRLLR